MAYFYGVLLLLAVILAFTMSGSSFETNSVSSFFSWGSFILSFQKSSEKEEANNVVRFFSAKQRKRRSYITTIYITTIKFFNVEEFYRCDIYRCYIASFLEVLLSGSPSFGSSSSSSFEKRKRRSGSFLQPSIYSIFFFETNLYHNDMILLLQR